MIQFSNQPIPYEDAKEEKLNADTDWKFLQAVAAIPVFFGSIFLLFLVVYWSVDPMITKKIVDWVNSLFGLGSHSFLNTYHGSIICSFMVLFSTFFVVYSIVFISERTAYVKNCMPLDNEQCKVAVKFFKKHPEYVYFLEEVRKQGRQMLVGELKALQSEAEEQKKNSGCKELYNVDIRSI